MTELLCPLVLAVWFGGAVTIVYAIPNTEQNPNSATDDLWLYNFMIFPMVAFKSDYLTSLWRPVLTALIQIGIIIGQFSGDGDVKPNEQFVSLQISLFIGL